MERLYYALKVAVIVIALITVAWTSTIGSHRIAHAVNEARYSAPAMLEHAVGQAVRDEVQRLFSGR